MPPVSTPKRKQKRVPRQYKPENLTMEDWQIALRRQDGQEKKFRIMNIGDHPVYSDFTVTDPQSDETHKVAIRSHNIELNFCSCGDFRTNTLGTCDHIEYVWSKLRKKKGAGKIIAEGHTPPYSSIFLRYGENRTVMLRMGTVKKMQMRRLAMEYFDEDGVLKNEAVERIETFVEEAEKLDPNFRCYGDAMDYIIDMRSKRKREKILEEKYADGTESPALKSLLKTELYRYQKEGVLFALRAGRCLLADDMGLGKTIQAIGTAKLMGRELGISHTLIICPTSLKYQWQREIQKLTDNSVQVIEGNWQKRQPQWQKDAFFTIASYHVAINDHEAIANMEPDLIVLDESQKIKNSGTVTAHAIKSLQSPYGILLTGTPLENRLEELHSLIEFIDPYHLGPLFRFLANHQMKDEAGKIIGYKNLHSIKKLLEPIMLRRTKKEVLSQLPERTDRNVFVPVTREQMEIHNEYQEVVARLVHKWQRQKFLHEKDRQRLMISLGCMRMVSNSTFILDQKTRHDTKIDELFSILDETLQNTNEKIVIFSQWERMTRLVASELVKRKINFVNLHGRIPSAKRKEILDQFRDDAHCRIFLSTDAGGIGLNLQSATTVVNLDLPWNPAVLEQRIGRIHRLGQKRPVLVVNLISQGTIEERILQLIGFKQSIFSGVLDDGDNTVLLNDKKFQGFMKAVETVADATEQQKETVETEKEQMTVEHKHKDDGRQAQTEDLFSSGIAFLEKLRDVASANTEKGNGATILSSFVECDPATGTTSLRIPVKDPQVLDRFGKLIEGVLEAMRK